MVHKMASDQIIDQRSKRRFLVTSKNLRHVIKAMAKYWKLSMSSLISELIDRGLQYEGQALKRAINAPLFKRPPNIEYIVKRSNKTYLSVSQDVYTKVQTYARKKRLKLVEATWTLISVGLQYKLGGETRSRKDFKTLSGLFGELAAKLKSKGTPFSEEYLADPELWVIDWIDQASTNKPLRKFRQGQGVPYSVAAGLSRQREAYRRYLKIAMKRIEALEKENKELNGKLVKQSPVEVREDINKKQNNGFPKLE
jgi:hypothetical protein